MLEQVPDALVAVEEVGVGYRVNQPFPEGEISGTITVEDVDSLVVRTGDARRHPGTRARCRASSPSWSKDSGLTETNYYIGYTAWLDLAPQGVSKASGLEMVCRPARRRPGRRAGGRRRLQRRRDARVGRPRRGDGPGAGCTAGRRRRRHRHRRTRTAWRPSWPATSERRHRRRRPAGMVLGLLLARGRRRGHGAGEARRLPARLPRRHRAPVDAGRCCDELGLGRAISPRLPHAQVPRGSCPCDAGDVAVTIADLDHLPGTLHATSRWCRSGTCSTCSPTRRAQVADASGCG